MNDDQKSREDLLSELVGLRAQLLRDQHETQQRLSITQELAACAKAKYDCLFASLADAALVVDCDTGIVLEANQRAETLFGKPRDGLLGMHFSELHPRTDSQRSVDLFNKHAIYPRNIGENLQILRANGQSLTVRIDDSSFQLDGRPVVLRLLHDMSSSLLAERALRDSEQLYRTLVETSPDAVIFFDLDLRLLTANLQTARLHGFEKVEDLLAWESTATGLVHPDDRDQLRLDALSALRSGSSRNLHYRARCRDGSFIPIELSTSIVRGADGNPKGFITVSRDITERLRDEEAIVSEKERLAVTLRSIADGVITTDIDGRVVLLNHMAEELTGFSVGEASGLQLDEIFRVYSEKNLTRLDSPASKVLRSGRPVETSELAILIDSKNNERFISHSASPIRSRDGSAVGVVIVFRDTTERHRMENELLKAQKLESISILAGGIAHDFNNILTGILGNIGLARIQAHSKDMVVRRLLEAERAVARAKDLTQQLLTFSKGGSPVRRTSTIGELIKDSSEFALRGSKVVCDFEIFPELWPASIDEGQVSQVINNLVINACQAMEQGGHLSIKADNFLLPDRDAGPIAPGRYVRILVSDNGGGISPENLSRIYDPYFTTKKTGSGLGLSTTYSIVKKHDGYIDVESVLGQGTRFTVCLPAADGPVFIKSREDSNPDPQGHGRVLLMDDDPSIRGVAEQMLGVLGYQVHPVCNGIEAIEAFAESIKSGNPFDVVVVDLTVPGSMGGLETIQKLRELAPKVRAIVSSGYSNDPVLSDFEKYGFCGMVAKPFNLHELAKTLRNAITNPPSPSIRE